VPAYEVAHRSVFSGRLVDDDVLPSLVEACLPPGTCTLGTSSRLILLALVGAPGPMDARLRPVIHSTRNQQSLSQAR
jgi:hypothetical protein